MGTRTILVIEDEEAPRELLKDIFDDAAFNVIAVGDGADALALVANTTVDLIILDLVMPAARMDGFAFLSEIRNHPNLVNTPLVIVSALGDTVANALGPAIAHVLKIAKVVPKPFDVQTLVRDVRRILGEEGGVA